MSKVYYDLNALLEMVEEPNRSYCKKVYDDNKQSFDVAQGSKANHHAWEGGYLDHIKDVMNIAVGLFKELDSCRQLEFSLSDSLFVLFLHDLEKPWIYGGSEQKKVEISKFADNKDFIREKIKEYGITLTADQDNALEYVHGEGKKYSLDKKTQVPLAAFVHICDTISARIWHNFPKERNSW
jgi:23S rRNA maturation-related 3'-5' exoribonuclease YhaM